MFAITGPFLERKPGGCFDHNLCMKLATDFFVQDGASNLQAVIGLYGRYIDRKEIEKFLQPDPRELISDQVKRSDKDTQ